jgi:hypothetical protein
LYSETFAADPALADPYHYWAACDAVRAATGKDKERPKVEPAEWSRLTGLALKWLRADLAHWTSQAKDPKQRQQVRDPLTDWNNEAALAPVRDPASLAAMPSADRKGWEALWRHVDTLLASINQQTRRQPAKP